MTTLQHDQPKTTAAQRSSLRAASVGNALEWFDWTLYGTFSAYLAVNLFDSKDPTSALLGTLGVFAGGFIARPLGGFLFGRIGDRLGRKFTLVTTMMLLACASLAIAVIPDYAQIGAWASVLLFAARLLQGLAHGGESGISYTYVAEIAPKEHRALWTSALTVGMILGAMVATGLGALLTLIFGAADMGAWGWRVGFAIGGVLGLYALWMRRKASESAVFEQDVKNAKTNAAPVQKMPTSKILKTAGIIFMFFAATNVVYYAWIIFAPSNAVATRGMDPAGSYIAALSAQALALILIPVFARLSDRHGRKPMVIAFGLGSALIAFPVQAIVGPSPVTLFLSMALGILVWSLTAGTFPALIAEQYPTRARALGVGVVTSICAAIFGGTAPYLNAWLASLNAAWAFQTYIIILALLTAAAGFVMKETKGKDLSTEVQ